LPFFIISIPILIAITISIFSNYSVPFAYAVIPNLNGVWSVSGVVDPERINQNQPDNLIYIQEDLHNGDLTGKYFPPAFDTCDGSQRDTFLYGTTSGNSITGNVITCEYSIDSSGNEVQGLYQDENFVVTLSPDLQSAYGYWIDMSAGYAHIPLIMTRVTNPVNNLVADAGLDQTVKPNRQVFLDGSNSQGNSITYFWTQLAGDPRITLSDPTSPNPKFMSPIPNNNNPIILDFLLTVTDSQGQTNSDTVRITVLPNHPPTAAAQADQNVVYEGTTVTLDGSKSSDPDQDQLAYNWTYMGDDPRVQIGNDDKELATFKAPAVDEDTTFTFQLVVNDGIVDSKPATVDVLVKPKITIGLAVDPNEINPYPLGVNVYQGGNPSPPLAQLLVIAKHVADDSPAKNFDINIESCTDIGHNPTSTFSPDADGHIHDSILRQDKCERLDRPFAILQVANKDIHGNPVSMKTDESGMISLSYTPSSYTNNTDGTTYYISGKDTVTAEWQKDPSMKGNATIVTRVPGLQQMPGSENCPVGSIGSSFGGDSSGNYFFIKQPFHECEFYATDETIGAIRDLANLYVEKQKECIQNNVDGICQITIGSQPSSDTIPVQMDNVIPLGITQMSLPWGGLDDINGNWQTPKHFNNDGKEVDITWKDQYGDEIDDDHKILLWSVIESDPRWNMPIKDLGGDFASTYTNIGKSNDDTLFHLEYYGIFPIS